MHIHRIAAVSAALFISALAGTAQAGPAMTLDQAKAVISAVEIETAELGIGDRAPNLRIQTWAQGEPVSEFVPGHTYVVEMWATWCGPCIAAIPHLNELSQSYKADGKNVTFIGTNIWERSSGEVREQAVRDFIEARNGEMSYTVAIEENFMEDGNPRPRGMMGETWMTPAGKNGIPAAFIVDGEGRIAWIGHPMQMDKPLAEIVGGDWDVDAAAMTALDEQRGEKILESAMPMLASETTADEGYRLLEAASLTSFAENSGYLSGLAGYVVSSPAQQVAVRNTDLAVRMAERAVEITAWEDASVVATLGMVHFKAGNKEGAETHLSKAIDIAGDESYDLNAVAWSIVSDEEMAAAFAPLAVKAATKAADASEWKDADILDTLAKAQWESGDKAAAVATQTKAVDAAEDRMKPRYTGTLEQYKSSM